jgi:septum formation protein
MNDISSPVIILASGSPRRKELLAAMGVDFEVIPSSYEEQLDDDRPPDAVACELALFKARDVAARYSESIVIGADTIVTVDGKQLGKPSDAHEARAMLKMLAGRAHMVTTGVVVLKLIDNIEIVRAESSTVYFRPYEEPVVDTYVESGDPFDKAGGYGIQSGAAPLIDSIKGNYDTIVGFPTKLVAEMLGEAGVPAKPVELEASVPVRS